MSTAVTSSAPNVRQRAQRRADSTSGPIAHVLRKASTQTRNAIDEYTAPSTAAAWPQAIAAATHPTIATTNSARSDRRTADGTAAARDGRDRRDRAPTGR